MNIADLLHLDAAIATATSAGFALSSWRVTRLHRQMRTDPLTGLANRAGLQRAFQRCARTDGWAAVLMVDLNGFKAINDTHGHRIGDQVLVEVGRRLRAQQRTGELAVRLSGDEFALWLGVTPGSALSTALDVEQRVRDTISVVAEPMNIDGLQLNITASVGAGVRWGRTATLEELLEPADQAMYRQKRTGRSRLTPGQPRRITASGVAA